MFAHFPQAQKDTYIRILLWLAMPLVSFFYNADAIKRGFINKKNFPGWMVEDTKKIIKSCCEMWSVFYKHVIVDRRFMPLSKIKHITQFDYNMIKWGLDKCTEHYPPKRYHQRC